MWESLFFWVFGSLAAVLAVAVVSLKNPVHSAVALIGNLFCIAALFVLLEAHFLAAMQVLVYAGAVLVLFLFVIMLLNLKPHELGRAKQTTAKIAGIILLSWVGYRLAVHFTGMAGLGFGPVSREYGSIEVVGELLFGRYLLAFEVASILLLASILGAVAIAKKRLW